MGLQEFNNAEKRSPFRLLWLLVPFAILGAASLGCGFVAIMAYYRYDFYRYLLFSLGVPLAMGILGGRFAIHCFWRASFQGNNRRSVKSALAFPLCVWIDFLYVVGQMIAYGQSNEMIRNEWVSIASEFITRETALVILFPFQLVLLAVALIGTIWRPYRFPF